MSTAITCPSCQKRFKGKPGLEGKKIKCPACGDPFVVPAAATAVAAEKPTPPKPAPKPEITFEAPKDDDAYGIGRIDTAPRCPNCAKEMVSAEATICIHCGYNTLTRVHGETKKFIAVTAGEHFFYLLPAILCAAGFFLLVTLLVFESTYLLEWFNGTGFGWYVSESSRMWRTIINLNILWGLGMYAFTVFALRPKPPDVEKE